MLLRLRRFAHQWWRMGGGRAPCSLGCTEGLQAAHCSFWAALTPAHRFPVPPVSGPAGMCQAGPWQPLEPITAGHAEAVRAGGVSLSLRQHRFRHRYLP